MSNLIIFLLIGAIAGWAAGKLMRGGGLGPIGNIALGIVGSYVGGHVLGWFGVYAYGLVGRILTAIVGAVIVLAVVGLFKKD